MITGTPLHLPALLRFGAAGMLMVLLYEGAVRPLRTLLPPLAAHGLDALFALSLAGGYVATALLGFAGRTDWYTLFCYAAGLLTGRLLLARGVRALLRRLSLALPRRRQEKPARQKREEPPCRDVPLLRVGRVRPRGRYSFSRMKNFR